MIDVKFDYKINYHFKISGHANSAVYGEDLICAGVTAIVSGMLNVFYERYQDDIEINVEDNLIEVKTRILNDNIKNDFKTLLIQLKTLEIQYPKNIKIREVH